MTQSVLWKFVFERRRFRQLLSSLAEWCAAYWEIGEKMGGDRETSGNGSFSLPPIFSPLVSYGGAHHSAANAVSERNLLWKITRTRQQVQRRRAIARKLSKAQFIF